MTSEQNEEAACPLKRVQVPFVFARQRQFGSSVDTSDAPPPSGFLVGCYRLRVQHRGVGLAGGRRSSPGCDGTGHAGLPLRPSGTPCSGREQRPSRQSSQPSRATWSETSVRPHRAEPECERSWPCCTPAREAEASPRWPSSTGTTDGPIDRILALFD